MFDGLRAAIQRDLDELSATGHLSRAVALSKATGQLFREDTMPQFFTGRLDAPIVLVHLNPKQDDGFPAEHREQPRFASAEAYVDYFRQFGRLHYGTASDGSHKSPFDHKQIRFLRPFEIIAFEDGDTDQVRRRNLERAVDDKLQLEIVPYGSSSFRTTGFSPDVLKPFWDLALDVIMETNRARQYVIFCGAVFRQLVEPYIVQRHEFYLKTAAGRPESNRSRFANLVITRARDSCSINAGWAPSFARQGIPMAEYGAKCAALYRQA